MFNKDKVKDVAKLAMIEIDDQDLNLYSEEIVNFLKLVEQTENIDLSEVEPLFHSPDNTLNAREDIVDKDKLNTFESVEYEGLYDFDKPFLVKSEDAYILDENPDVVYMTNMHVILHLSDNRIVNITSNKGKYNKDTQDCFFEESVKATDGETIILAENLDLLATESFVKVYNKVKLNNPSGSLSADKVDYDFETKYFKVSMFDDKVVKMKVIR